MDDGRAPAPPPLDAVFRQSDAVVTRVVADETLLVPVSGELAHLQRIFVLNQLGAFLWQAFDGRTPLGHLVDAVTARFETDPDTARSDLLAFVDEMRAARLLDDVPLAAADDADDR
ncbi:MAG: PqqD family protein [Acidobacteriota bacterium]